MNVINKNSRIELRRFLSTAAVEKKKPAFAASLHLPKTSFPLRPPANRQTDKSVVNRITTENYMAQQQQENPSGEFSLLDGPPFANGQLHAGHFLNKVLKDAINRFQVSRGKRVSYTPGWDCHGLPIELLALKQLSKGTSSLTPIDIRPKCSGFAHGAMQSQASDFQSWGVMANWDPKSFYNTMSWEFESREALLLERLFSRNLIHRGLKPVHWSPTSRTALAEAELEYRDDHVSLSIFAKFRSLSGRIIQNIPKPVSLVIWTTTPWSLTGNQAVAVHSDADYSIIEISGHNDEVYCIATELIESLQKKLQVEKVNILAQFKGAELLGSTCVSPLKNTRVPIIHGKHVTVDSGTGLVHIAPMHGVEDWESFTEAFPSSMVEDCQIELDGRFKSSAGAQFEGKLALFEGNNEVVEYLGSCGLLLGEMTPFKHRYPYDWRTKSPVMTIATRQFFIRVENEVESLAKEAVESVVETFVPQQSKRRLLATLGTRKEWCISRQRSWGLPIPYYWKSDSDDVLFNSEIILNFSKQLKLQQGSDFWFKSEGGDSADEVLPESERGKGWRRGRDTLDVWFDSGSAWFASNSQRDMNQVDDLVLEGSDQHRGWFQSSLLTKVACLNQAQAPFKALVTHGFVLDEQGQKMSKSLGNVVTPQQAMKKCGGVDVLRLWSCLGDAVNGDVSLGNQSLNGAQDAYKKIRNMMRFFLSVVSDENVQSTSVSDLEPIDRWMLHHLKVTCDESIAGYSSYNVRNGVKPLLALLQSEPLTVFLEQSKDRLYCDRKSDTSRQSCIAVYRHLLVRLSSLIAPICVFTIDELLEHGCKSVFGEVTTLVQLKNQDAPKEWEMSKQWIEAFDFAVKVRAEVNKMKIKDDIRGRCVVRVSAPKEVITPELLQLLSTKSVIQGDRPWSCLSEILQVSKVDIVEAGEFSLQLQEDEEQARKKCDRCRKYHESVRQTNEFGEESSLCNRCIHSHSHNGL